MVVWRHAWQHEEGRTKVQELFQRSFQEEPTLVWSAPGRVNLIGEHTDYNGGMALPIALPHRTYAALRPRKDRIVRLVSAQEEGIREIDLDEVDTYSSAHPVDGWPAYVVGVAWAMEKDTGVKVPGFDVAVDSCVPYGSGLSSSAALEGAVVGAIMKMSGVEAPVEDMVTWCVQAENDIAGAPTGGMDQSAVLRCQEGEAIALDCQTFTTQSVPFDLGARDLDLLVIDTRAEHSHATGGYGQRRASCEDAADILGVENLAQIDDLDEALGRLEDPILKKRVRHVVTEIERTKEAITALENGNIERVGELFNASHDSLRDDYEVTCPELDTAQEVALAQGALGARMTGGGFGGSAIAIVPTSSTQAVAEAIAEEFAGRGFVAPQFLAVHAAEAAGEER